jgi:hypothetical protein
MHDKAGGRVCASLPPGFPRADRRQLLSPQKTMSPVSETCRRFYIEAGFRQNNFHLVSGLSLRHTCTVADNPEQLALNGQVVIGVRTPRLLRSIYPGFVKESKQITIDIHILAAQRTNATRRRKPPVALHRFPKASLNPRPDSVRVQ